MTNANSLNLLLIRQILSHPYSFKWSLQGLGMLRLYLSEHTRLHVWSTEHVVKDVSEIHTHPWDFTSEVLVGRIVDKVYHCVATGVPVTKLTHNECKLKCGEGAHLLPNSHRMVRLEMHDERIVDSGESYMLSAHEVHSSRAEHGTVSVITRRFKADTEHALVYYPLDTEWVSAEPRKATEDEVKLICSAALKKMENLLGSAFSPRR